MKKRNNTQIHRRRHHKKRIWLRWLLGIVIVLVVVDTAIVYKMYTDANTAVTGAYKSVPHKTSNSRTVDFKKGDPFSILLLGTDTGEFGRTDRGRSDSIMVAGVSPNKTTLVSVPRDTLVQIAGHSGNNKINAAYAYGGVAGSLNTLQSYLSIPLDKYIEVNLRGLKDISKVLGPVTVKNDIAFTHLNKHFKPGKVKIDLSNILAYTGMRKEDPRGDYGRQARQRAVLAALIKKLAHVKNISRYSSILEVLSANMKTDLTFADLRHIYQHYQGATHVKQIQLSGQGQMIDGVSYEVVPKDNLVKVRKALHKSLNLSVEK